MVHIANYESFTMVIRCTIVWRSDLKYDFMINGNLERIMRFVVLRHVLVLAISVMFLSMFLFLLRSTCNFVLIY